MKVVRFFSSIISSEAAHHLRPQPKIAAAWRSHVQNLSSAALWELLDDHYEGNASSAAKKKTSQAIQPRLLNIIKTFLSRISIALIDANLSSSSSSGPSWSTWSSVQGRHRPIITTWRHQHHQHPQRANAWWWIRTHPQKYEKHHFWHRYPVSTKIEWTGCESGGTKASSPRKKCSARIQPHKDLTWKNLPAAKHRGWGDFNEHNIHLPVLEKKTILRHFHWLVFSKSGCIYSTLLKNNRNT